MEDSDRSRTIVVGASLGGLRVAEGMRRMGYEGSIDIFGDEPHLPYDRPPLSKDVLLGEREAEDTEFRDAARLADQGIVVHVSSEVTALDSSARVVTANGESWGYDNLVIASGARPRQLAGSERLGGVHSIRTREDAASIRAALLAGPQLVVVGAGFIGAEVASAARHLGLDVTVVEGLPRPLERAVGTQAGAACAALHAEYGTDLICGTGVSSLAGRDHVEAVVLADGRRLEATLVVVGIGVIPNTEWLGDNNFDLSNGVACDENLRAGAEGVYAVGDVASWLNPRYGEQMRIEHWTTTVEQTLVVAHNIMNPDAMKVCDPIPFFWSDQYGHRIQFAGRSAADEVAEPAVDEGVARYLALYRRGDQLVGVLAIDGTAALVKLRGRMAKGETDWADSLDFVASLGSQG